jgi:hypothetical protein
MSWYQKAAVLASLFPKRIRITNGQGADAAVMASSPVGTEEGLVVRNIPSGIQKVQITSETPGIPLSFFSEVSSVAAGATVSVLSYTVPPATTQMLQKVDVSGSNIAIYDIIINGSTFARKRTYFGGSLSDSVDCGGGFTLSSGDQVVVTVNNFRPSAGDFEVRIQLLQV